MQIKAVLAQNGWMAVLTGGWRTLWARIRNNCRKNKALKEMSISNFPFYFINFLEVFKLLKFLPPPQPCPINLSRCAQILREGNGLFGGREGGRGGREENASAQHLEVIPFPALLMLTAWQPSTGDSREWEDWF